MVWSSHDKTLCLWSAISGSYLGKVSSDKDPEESGASASWEYTPEASKGSFSGEDGAKMRINSMRVRRRPPTDHCCRR